MSYKDLTTNILKGMSGKAIYLSVNQQMLIIEAIDMLESDYQEEGHIEQEELDKIKNKIRY